MREIQTHPPMKAKVVDVVRRLEFFEGGAELVAWVGPEQRKPYGRTGFTNRLYTFEFAADCERQLYAGWLFGNDDYEDDCTPDPVVAPSRRVLVFEVGWGYDIAHVRFEDVLTRPLNRNPSLSFRAVRAGWACSSSRRTGRS
jgi:hypothetical protein